MSYPDDLTAPARTALLIRGACVYRADADGEVIPNGSVLAIDGTIAAVGPTADVDARVAALPEDLRLELTAIDGRGHMVLPGFVNDHWHELFATRLAFRGALRPARDRDDRAAFMALGGDLATISSAFDSFASMIERLEPDEALAIARYSLWTQLRSGVTTLADVGSVNRSEALIAAARDLGMRCMVTTWASDAACPCDGSPLRITRPAEAVLERMEEVLRQCAKDDSGLIRGWPTAVYGTNMTDRLGTGLAELSERFDTPFASHIGALRHEVDVMRAHFGMTPVRRFANLGLVNDRLLAVHCAFADDEERRLLLDAGAHISHSPAKYGAAGETTVTETRVIPALRRAGLPVSVSTDGAGLPIGGMAEAMRAAWQMHNELYGDPTTVLPTDALAMATRIPAEGLRWDRQIGSLETGKQADLVLIPTNDWRYLLTSRPLEAFLALGGSQDVHTVIVAGQILVREGRATRVDEHQLEADYLEALRDFSVRGLGIDTETVTAAIRR
ncbi:amidohydrolase family protein [Streptomyces monashensis]|uniref:amidohydrolase family protein n=1 Tax=Streptomyces monashensis TaxID=1678012 RepID=UPI0033EA48ED